MAVATGAKLRLYQETYGLLKAYNTNLTFRNSFKNAVSLGKKSYVGTPLWLFIWILMEASPHLRPRFSKTFIDAFRKEDFKEVSNSLDELFKAVWENKTDRENLEQQTAKIEASETDHPQFVSNEDHQQLTEAYNIPEGPVREAALEHFSASRVGLFNEPIPSVTSHAPSEPTQLSGPEAALNPKARADIDEALQNAKSETLTGTPPPVEKTEIPGAFKQWRDADKSSMPKTHPEFKPSAPSVNPKRNFSLPSLKIPKTPKIPLSAEKLIKNITTPKNLATVFTTGLGGVVGFGITKTPLGAGLGMVTGWSFPTLIGQKGAGQLVLTGLNKTGNAGGTVLSELGRKGSTIQARGAAFKKTATGTRVVLILIGLFALFSLMSLMGFAPQTPGNTPGTTGTAGGGGASIATGSGILAGGGEEIAQCTFYRGGDKSQGLTIGNPALAALISDISTKVGVPGSIVAGIMRVETGGALSSSDSSYLTNDYDSHCSLPSVMLPVPSNQTLEVCGRSGIAFGIMQFTPDTFKGTFNINQTDMQNIFGKTSFNSQLKAFDQKEPDNVLRIYSVKDSIIAAAFKLRADKQSINSTGTWDEATVKEIAARYYGRNADGTTNYVGYDGSTQNYGNDLWKSYSSCIAPTTPIGTLASFSCPIPGGKISCASYGPPTTTGGFDGICTPASQISTNEVSIGGHCSPKYREAYPSLCSEPGTTKPFKDASGNLRRTAKSIDIEGPVGQHVFMPTINGEKVGWTWEGDPSDDVGAVLRIFKSDPTPQGIWTIHFVHSTAEPSFAPGTHVMSDEHVATISSASCPGCHIHISVGLNLISPGITSGSRDAPYVFDPNWKFPDRELAMCN